MVVVVAAAVVVVVAAVVVVVGAAVVVVGAAVVVVAAAVVVVCDAVVVDATLVAVEAVLADVVDAVVVSGSGFAASPPLLPKMFGKFRLLGKNNLGALVVVVWVEAVVAAVVDP